jgi:hypothetical protein
VGWGRGDGWRRKKSGRKGWMDEVEVNSIWTIYCGSDGAKNRVRRVSKSHE